MSRPIALLLVGVTLCAQPIVAAAGQIYGTIRSNGRPLINADLRLLCGSVSAPARTSPSGVYRVFINGAGRCTLIIGGSPVENVYLYDSPTRYDFNSTRGTFQRQ